MSEMVQCRGCGREIHRTAANCPQCGAAQRTNRYKSKTVAGVFGIVLGGFGIHRFYLGQWWGVFYLLLVWTYIPGLIALVEGIVFLLSDQEKWDQKYNEGIPGETSAAGIAVVAVVAVLGGFVIVGIVGILAAIAIPAYQQYALRAEVAEAINETVPVRQAVADAIARNGTIEARFVNDSLRQVEGETRYLQHVQVSQAGDIVLMFNSVSEALAGKTLVFEPVLARGQVSWSCNHGSLELRYRPSACR